MVYKKNFKLNTLTPIKWTSTLSQSHSNLKFGMGSVESRVVDEEEAEPYQNDETSETEVTLKVMDECMRMTKV